MGQRAWLGAFTVGLAAITVPLLGQSAPSGSPLLVRHYTSNEPIAYRLTTTHTDRTAKTTYAATARAVVTSDTSGHFFEPFHWSDLVWNGEPFVLPEASQKFTQVLSLDPDHIPRLPDFSTVHPRLIGPSADLMNFYADVWLAAKQTALRQVGDQVVVPSGTPNSWADGTRVIVGEDAIDFVISVEAVSDFAIKLRILHRPPDHPTVPMRADWMNAHVGDQPNNWTQIRKTDDGYLAAVGMEVIDVHAFVNVASGKILSADMDNPVQVVERQCNDAALTMCGNPLRYQILRHVDIVEAP
jgi:hypothetical protein